MKTDTQLQQDARDLACHTAWGTAGAHNVVDGMTCA